MCYDLNATLFNQKPKQFDNHSYTKLNGLPYA